MGVIARIFNRWILLLNKAAMIMTSRNILLLLAPDTAGPDCWSQMGLEYALVEECIADGLGDVLHAANGEETTSVANPPVTNVPWSNFDGEHLEGGEYWEIEEVGLLAFICQKFTLSGCPAINVA